VTREEFVPLFRDLLLEPLQSKPNEQEMPRVLEYFYGKLSYYSAPDVQAAIRTWIETPSCDVCGRNGARMPSTGNLLWILRKRRQEGTYREWPKGLDPRRQIENAKDDGWQPSCAECDDTGWMPLLRGGVEAVQRCTCAVGQAMRGTAA